MFAYVALQWDPAIAEHGDAAQRIAEALRTSTSSGAARWQILLDARGLRVLCRGARANLLDAQVLEGHGGVVLGALFERPHDPLDASLTRRWRASASDDTAILESRGRWLIEHCWGNYVALGLDAHTGRPWVLKDPCGELPCLVTMREGVTVIFSCITDLLETGLFRFTIRTDYLAARVRLAGLAGARALHEVEPVGRGEWVELGARLAPGARPDRAAPAWSGVRRQFYWHPRTFTQRSRCLEDRDEAARAMRATVRSCVQSWAGRHERILHRLSGGLDSSIIAACLTGAAHAPRILCYTYFHPRGRADERPWARLAARHVGLEHIECAVAPRDFQLQRGLEIPPAPEPVALLGYVLRSTLEHALVAERGATAVFCGDGGDSGFGGEAYAYALSDYLLRHGPDREAFQLTADIARLTGHSSIGVVARAVRRVLSGDRMEPLERVLRHGSKLVHPELRARSLSLPRYPHPWFAAESRVPWGLIRQLGMLLAAPQCYDVAHATAETPEVIAPLYAQPAVELFLRIPLYRHFESGRERGLARRAFAGDVPRVLLERQWKDRAPGFHDELIYRNRAWLRELLLDGVLVRERLLDARALEQIFSDRLSGDAVLPGEILRHLDVELWARTWNRSSRPRL